MITDSSGSHVAIFAACGVVGGVLSAQVALAQPAQYPIGARMEFQVAHVGGTWGSSLVAQPGDRIEWRVIVSYTGNDPNVDALGGVYYQPIFHNVDNAGSGSSADNLGVWRNGGASGIGNTNILQGMLSNAEGESTSALASYGRVTYGYTPKNLSSGPLFTHRHSNGSNEAPAGDYIRVASSLNTLWYPSNMPIPTVELYSRVLNGMVSDNPTRNGVGSQYFRTGTQNLTLFR